MRRGQIIAILLVFALATTAARGATPDLSSPRAAAKSLFDAISLGDHDAIAESLWSDSEEQRELASAMADMIIAGKKLGDAARNRFGKAGEPIGRGMLDPADRAKLDDTTVEQMSPDAAVLRVPGQSRPMSFRRRDDKWRLVINDSRAAAAEGNIDRQVRLVRLMADAMESSAIDIATGTYKTPDAAVNAIQQRLQSAMLMIYRPATTRAVSTTAATTPSTAPSTAATRP